eukprot:IDg11671t1
MVQRGGMLPHCIGFLDSTEIQIACPCGESNFQHSVYSGYKSGQGLHYLCCSPRCSTDTPQSISRVTPSREGKVRSPNNEKPSAGSTGVYVVVRITQRYYSSYLW